MFNVGIDIDGVITDVTILSSCLKDTINFLSDKKISEKTAIDILLSQHSTNLSTFASELFNINKLNFEKVFSNMVYEKYYFSKPREGVSEQLLRLKNAGANIYIITARHNNDHGAIVCREKEGYDYKYHTMRYFLEYNIPCDRLMFDTKDKAIAIKENNIEFMLDDYDANLIYIQKNAPNCKTCLFNTIHNENINKSLFSTSVNSMKEFVDYVLVNKGLL